VVKKKKKMLGEHALNVGRAFERGLQSGYSWRVSMKTACVYANAHSHHRLHVGALIN